MKVPRYLRDAALFAPCYVALDWANYFDPVGPFDVTPWNPQPALAIVWLVLGGLAQVPAVLATIMLADLLVRHMPAGLTVTVLSSLVLSAGYLGIAWALKALLSDTGLRSTRQLTIFAGVVVAGSGVLGAASVGTLQGLGVLADAAFATAWMRFWVVDAAGILVTAPLLFAVADAARRPALGALVRKPEAQLQALVLGATVWFVFAGSGADPSRLFYLLFLPIIWIAVRFGLNGAILAAGIVQIGVALGEQSGQGIALPVLGLQTRLVALTLTGLYLGVMVDQRQQAEESLRQSLRLAAAGEMAGAIAHEVNQPLTAVSSYGQSARRLLERDPGSQPQVREIVDRMLAEADRAAEVVRRLRDFFRAGTTLLAEVPVEQLVAAARRAGEAAIAGRDILFEVEAQPGMPPLYVDRLQVEVILRNLIANAAESLAGARQAGGRIRVSFARHGAGQARIVVADSGPGIAPAVRETLFEPFVSGKSTGMGLGLAVSRAIAEAHGGSLAASPAQHGEFHLILPCAPNA